MLCVYKWIELILIKSEFIKINIFSLYSYFGRYIIAHIVKCCKKKFDNFCFFIIIMIIIIFIQLNYASLFDFFLLRVFFVLSLKRAKRVTTILAQLISQKPKQWKEHKTGYFGLWLFCQPSYSIWNIFKHSPIVISYVS